MMDLEWIKYIYWNLVFVAFLMLLFGGTNIIFLAPLVKNDVIFHMLGIIFTMWGVYMIFWIIKKSKELYKDKLANESLREIRLRKLKKLEKFKNR